MAVKSIEEKKDKKDINDEKDKTDISLENKYIKIELAETDVVELRGRTIFIKHMR